MNPATPQQNKQPLKRDQSGQQDLEQTAQPDDVAADAHDESHDVQHISREQMEKLKPADPDPDDPAQA